MISLGPPELNHCMYLGIFLRGDVFSFSRMRAKAPVTSRAMDESGVVGHGVSGG